MCSAMGQADSAGPTPAGVSRVEVGYVPVCGGPGNGVRDYTYFPVSWENSTVAAVYPGYVNVFGLRQYDGMV